MRFLGNIEAKTDAKGRAFLPANFRKILQVSGEEKLVLRKDVFQPCLVIYPESVWNEQLDQLRSKLSRWNAKEQQIYRSFIADAILLTLDGNGRFQTSSRTSASSGWETPSKSGEATARKKRLWIQKNSARHCKKSCHPTTQ